MAKSNTNIPLKVGARVTHVSDKRYVVGVVVHQNADGRFDVHWQMPPWKNDRESRGSYVSEDLKRTYAKDSEIKKAMMKQYNWNMSDAFQVEDV